jgi:hypothetical protein
MEPLCKKLFGKVGQLKGLHQPFFRRHLPENLNIHFMVWVFFKFHFRFSRPFSCSCFKVVSNSLILMKINSTLMDGKSKRRNKSSSTFAKASTYAEASADRSAGRRLMGGKTEIGGQRSALRQAQGLERDRKAWVRIKTDSGSNPGIIKGLESVQNLIPSLLSLY